MGIYVSIVHDMKHEYSFFQKQDGSLSQSFCQHFYYFLLIWHTKDPKKEKQK